MAPDARVSASASLLRLPVATGTGTRGGAVRQPADRDEYVGLVTDDVHHLGGDRVKLSAIVYDQMPSTPPGVVRRAVSATPVQNEAVLDAAVSGR